MTKLFAYIFHFFEKQLSFCSASYMYLFKTIQSFTGVLLECEYCQEGKPELKNNITFEDWNDTSMIYKQHGELFNSNKGQNVITLKF